MNQEDKKLVVISAPVATRSGYGDHARDLVRSFIKLYDDKWDIRILTQRWGTTPMNALTSDDDDIISRFQFEDLHRQPDVWMQVTIPNEFQRIGKYNIGITAGIETDICSPEWIEGCNRMNMVIVPSQHAKDVLINTEYKKYEKETKKALGVLKVKVPVHVLFEGFDESVFKKTDLISKSVADELRGVKEDFCFLFVGHWLKGELGADRKDVGMLIKVFIDTFKGRKDRPALILKTSGATFSVTDREQILHKISVIRRMCGDLEQQPSIYLLHGDLEPEEMNSLYNHPKVKVHVSFTHGEGFGRPLLEATLSGKPVIAPNWSGQVDFLNPEMAVMLPGELRKVDQSTVWKDTILADSKWFYVDYQHAAKVLYSVHAEYDKYLERSRKHVKYSRDKYTYARMTEELGKLIKAVDLDDVQTVVALNLPTFKSKLSTHELTTNLPKIDPNAIEQV